MKIWKEKHVGGKRKKSRQSYFNPKLLKMNLILTFSMNHLLVYKLFPFHNFHYAQIILVGEKMLVLLFHKLLMFTIFGIYKASASNCKIYNEILR